MDTVELLTRFESHYSKTNEHVKQDISNLIKTKLLEQDGDDSERLEKLYDTVLENYPYKTFPSYAFFITALEKGDYTPKSQYDFVGKVQAESRNMTITALMERYNELWEKSHKGKLSNEEGDFIHYWGHLHYVYSELQAKKMPDSQIISYCGKVRETVLAGEEVRFNPLKIRAFIRDEDIRYNKETSTGKIFEGIETT